MHCPARQEQEDQFDQASQWDLHRHVQQSQRYGQPERAQQEAETSQMSTSTALVKRHRTCQVCGVDVESFHLNYGASACLCCRAFFRRAVQGNHYPLFACRNGDACHITVKTRRRCQKCRFTKCLSAGMQLESVMDQGQKKQRFRKMIKKQKRIAKKTNDPLLKAAVVSNCLVFPKRGQSGYGNKSQGHRWMINDSSSIMDGNLSSVDLEASLKCNIEDTEVCTKIEPVDEETIEAKAAADKDDDNTCDGSESCKYPTACLLGQNCQTSSYRPVSNDFRVRKRMIRQIQHIRQSWAKSLQSKMSRDSQFVQDLICSHLGQFSLTKTALKSHLMSLASVFKNFALQQPEFTELPFADQHRLLCRNVPTFVQFVISMYLSAEDPEDQISWMLLHSNYRTEYNPDNLHFMSLFILNERLSLLKGDCCEYLSQLDKLCLLRPSLSPDETPFFALNCLFSPSHSSLVDKTETIYDYQDDIKTLVRWKHEVYGGVSLKELTKSLLAVESMTDTFERMVDWESDSSGYLFSFYSMPHYHLDAIESHWLQDQLDNFYRCFSAVSCGEEFVRQYVLAAHNVTLPLTFTLHGIAIFSERTKRLLKSQEDFNRLSSQRQADMLVSRSVLDPLALQCMQQVCCETGLEQIKYLFGCKDNELMESHEMMSLLKRSRIEKVEFRDVVKSSGIYEEETVAKIDLRCKDIGQNFKDVSMYMLFMYSLMFRYDQAPALHNRFVRHLVHLRSLQSDKDGKRCTVEDSWEWYKDIMVKFEKMAMSHRMFMGAAASMVEATKIARS